MPYVVVKKVNRGYKVCSPRPRGRCLSKKPLTKEMAQKQELAVRLTTLRKEGKIPPRKEGKGKLFSKPKKIFDESVNIENYLAPYDLNELKRQRRPKKIQPIESPDIVTTMNRMDEALSKMPRQKYEGGFVGKGHSSFAMLPKQKCKF